MSTMPQERNHEHRDDLRCRIDDLTLHVVNGFNRVDAEMRSGFERVDTQLRELRQETKADIAELGRTINRFGITLLAAVIVAQFLPV